MSNLNTVSKIIIVAITGAILIVLFIVYGGPGSANQMAATPTATSSESTPTGISTPTSTAAQAGVGSPSKSGASNNHPAAPTAKPPTVITLHIITPVASDIWKIGMQDLISWDKPGGFSGSISLIDATTQQSIGVILPQVGPNQTSYTWNTRDILLNRSNPYKKDVLPGTYEIQISYDGNNVQPVTSAVFTITN